MTRRARQGEALAHCRTIAADLTDGPCIEWPFSRTSRGYGAVGYDGRVQQAHRVVHILATGSDAEGLQVAHSCGNRPCIRPAHLRWATQSENELDKVGHGTSARGDRSATVKVPDAALPSIRAELAAGAPLATLAARHGVSTTTIRRIRDGERKTAVAA